ncbi:HD domain-containing phosphohydrolase [Clostridium sp.]|uniref:HD-GYP domain-containing protein n=1 Tax=Clostridium sp. TaxID=1506 RepID=UPI00258DC70D|nr:HD domain-containing phosphohydrolase [Clostridium sp.]MDF2505679.1 rpfG1 [Clostridium sp.]
MFDDDNNFAILKNAVIKKSDEYVLLNKKKDRIIKINSNNILNLVKEKRKIIIYKNDNDNEYSPLMNISSSEVLIPILGNYMNSKEDSTDVIASIYIGNFSENTNSTIDNINQGEIYHRMCKIQNLYQSIYLSHQREKTMLNLLNVLSEIISDNDPCGVLHPYHVANISKEIGKALRLDDITLKQIYIAGLLHDIGKLYIDNSILNKEGALTEDEFEIVKKHSVYGANIVKDVFDLDDISVLVKYHHEKCDGTGYPNGLTGEQIPLGSRILCLADSVDSMLSPRTYKEPRNVEFVIGELLKNRSKQFDAKIVDVMINMLLKANEETTDILSDTIIWSTLTMYTTKTVYSIEGTLGKYDFGYYFKANKFNFSTEINKDEIRTINLYINKNNNMYCYELKSDYYESNTLHISSFDYIPFLDSFNILWNLDGILNLDSLENLDINIYKIGGSRLMFYIDKKQIKEDIIDKILSLEVYFKDKENILLTGKIVNTFKVGNKNSLLR